MKRNLLWGTWAIVAATAWAADPAVDEVKAAAKKLGEKANYSWRTTVETPDTGGGQQGAGRFRPGPTDGKTDKEGWICLAITRGETTTEAVVKGEKVAVKTDEGWQAGADLQAAGGGGGGGQGQRNPGRGVARMLEDYKAPAAAVEELLAKVSGLSKSGDAYVGNLTEQGVKDLMWRGRARAGGEGPAVSNAKGSVKFWVKDGVLAKYESKVQGKITFNNRDMDIDRTTTTEIKDVGTTKLAVPEEAKKKF